ncbi:MAG: GSCFA domain-containing protein [Paludibacteraceae bacterium]
MKITYNDKLMALGSCFSENIGSKLDNAFFQVNINPFGVLYNPLSVSKSLETLMDEHTFSIDDVFEYQFLWSSFSHSSLFSGATQNECLEKINSSTTTAIDFLKKTRFLLITLGTAWVYEDEKSGEIVANCHNIAIKEI